MGCVIELSMKMKGEGENGKVVVMAMGRAEIDLTPPFKSVKEAVMLFGERVLVKEIYGLKLKQMEAAVGTENGGSQKTRVGELTAELEEARQSLQKTREEITKMSTTTRTLKQELEETKKELKLMKAKRYYNNLKPEKVDKDNNDEDNDPEIEDLKFVENAISKEEEECDQKRRYVTFASPPGLAHVIVGKEEMGTKRWPLDWNKKKKKPLTMRPIIGWLFSVKKSSGHEVVVMNSPKRK